MMGVVQKEHCEGCDLGLRSVDDGVRRSELRVMS